MSFSPHRSHPLPAPIDSFRFNPTEEIPGRANAAAGGGGGRVCGGDGKAPLAPRLGGSGGGIEGGVGLACAHAGGGGMPFSSSPGGAVAFGGGRGGAPGRAGIERPRRCCSEFFSDSLSDLGLGGGRGGGRAGGTAPFFAPFFFTGLCSFFFTDVGRGFGGGGPTDPSPLVVRKLFVRSFIVAPDELLSPPLFARALGLGGGGPGRDGGGGGAPTLALLLGLLGLLGGGGFGLGGGPGGGSRAPTGTCVPLFVLAGLSRWCSSTGGGLPCEEPL